MALFNYAANFIGQQVNAFGTVGSGQNTQQVLTNANTYAYLALGQAPPFGAAGPTGTATDANGGGTVGGQSPSSVSFGSGIAGSGSNSNTTCMSGPQMNPIKGKSTVGQTSEGFGDATTTSVASAKPCTSQGGNAGVGGTITDPTDPTDFMYTNNADSM